MTRAGPVVLGVAGLVLAVAACTGSSEADSAGSDWRAEWAVVDSLSLAIDSEGYEFPTAIAFVPDPGDRPTDPLYFVTELRGKIKVVTNDRTVHTFAEVDALQPVAELPDLEGQGGLAGICLDPQRGYVFVTFAHRDELGVLRNNVIRFDSRPGTFGLAPEGVTGFSDLLAPYVSAISHQIGGCRVHGDRLFLSIGDGGDPIASQELDQLVGKLLRLDLDGHAPPDNPFFDPNRPTDPAGYVYAYGLRNPFGLYATDEGVYIAENGRAADRFVRIEPGTNYGWDGTDWSITSNADMVFTPGISPVQLDRVGAGDGALLGKDPGTFLIAVAGTETSSPGIIGLPYDSVGHRVTGSPEYLLEHIGPAPQNVVGLALGPDAVYVAPILPDSTGRSYVLRLGRDGPAHPYVIGQAGPLGFPVDEGFALIEQHGCLQCHQLAGAGATAAPTLDPLGLMLKLNDRLYSSGYLERLDLIDQIDQEPFRSSAAARQQVREAGRPERTVVWMKNRILEPKFDDPDAKMPNLGLSEAEAEAIAEFLTRVPSRSLPERIGGWLLGILPNRTASAAFSGSLGGALLMLGVFAGWRAVSRWRGRRSGG